MLRITVTQSATSPKTLKLEGRLTGAWVEELRRVCAASFSGDANAPLTIDLSGVSFIDDDGVDLFRSLSGRRIEVTGCSPFLTDLLKEVWPCS